MVADPVRGLPDIRGKQNKKKEPPQGTTAIETKAKTIPPESEIRIEISNPAGKNKNKTDAKTEKQSRR